MKDYKYYIEKIKKELDLTNEKIIKTNNSIELVQNIVNWCRKELKKYYSEGKLHELEIVRDTLEAEIFLIRSEAILNERN